METKRYLIKKYLTVAVIVAVIAGLLALLLMPLFRYIYYNSKIEKLLENIPCESESVPYVFEYGILHTPEKKINLEHLLSKKTGDDTVRIDDVFCVANGKVYFVYGAKEWRLASFSLSTGELEQYALLSDGETRYDSGFKYFYDEGIRHTDRFAEYSQRHGYYLDGKIILNNYSEVLVFDVASETYEKMSSAEYAFPKYEPLCEVEYIDGEQKLTLFLDSGEKVFTLGDMAKTSEGIAAIYSLKDHPTWDDGFTCLGNFFSPTSVASVNGRIYAMGILMNYGGEGHIVILEYDEQKNAWKHVKNFYYWQYLHGYAYFVNEL